MFHDDFFDDGEFERGFEEARERAHELKDAIRYIQKCNETRTTYGDHIFRLKDELLSEGYIIETELDFEPTEKGLEYANSPGVPSLGYLMHHGLPL